MPNCVFMHRPDSIYADNLPVQYQFPKRYLNSAIQCVGNWIVYLEPTKLRHSRGYFAVAKVKEIIADPSLTDMYLAVIESGTYLDFPAPVPFNDGAAPNELGLLNGQGKLSGRAQSAIRVISNSDFLRILDKGLDDLTPILPREITCTDQIAGFAEPITPFLFEQPRDRVLQLSTRAVRDKAFRRLVLEAYDERCSITGLKLINGGGRAEVNAAHIRPVERDGPDSVINGIAMSGTAHWMFDRGLITLNDDLEIIISRQVNDEQGVRSFVNNSGFAIAPLAVRSRPHPRFLEWHRQNIFKH